MRVEEERVHAPGEWLVCAENGQHSAVQMKISRTYCACSSTRNGEFREGDRRFQPEGGSRVRHAQLRHCEPRELRRQLE